MNSASPAGRAAAARALVDDHPVARSARRRSTAERPARSGCRYPPASTTTAARTLVPSASRTAPRAGPDGPALPDGHPRGQPGVEVGTQRRDVQHGVLPVEPVLGARRSPGRPRWPPRRQGGRSGGQLGGPAAVGDAPRAFRARGRAAWCAARGAPRRRRAPARPARRRRRADPGSTQRTAPLYPAPCTRPRCTRQAGRRSGRAERAGREDAAVHPHGLAGDPRGRVGHQERRRARRRPPGCRAASSGRRR